MRSKYTVTLFMSDGSKPAFTAYADSPEGAIRKIREREEPLAKQFGLTVDNGWAELIRTGEE